MAAKAESDGHADTKSAATRCLRRWRGVVSAAACCCVMSAAAATTKCFVDVVGGDCDVAFRRDGESRVTAAAGVHVVRAAR